jgi:ATP-dependent Clp protease protease subunit
MAETQVAKEAYVRFMAPVFAQHVNALMRMIDVRIRDGFERLHLLLSSPGGVVFHGISVHNYLRGVPLEIFTYNFGSVDSIGVVIFCAGKRRFSVPHARFLIHGVQVRFQGPSSHDEKSLEESLKGLRIDEENIARIIADTCGKKQSVVEHAMNARTTLSPRQAIKFGLVHQIRVELIPAFADIDIIYEDGAAMTMKPEPKAGPSPVQPGAEAPAHVTQIPASETRPAVEGFTRSLTIDHVTVGQFCGTLETEPEPHPA